MSKPVYKRLGDDEEDGSSPEYQQGGYHQPMTNSTQPQANTGYIPPQRMANFTQPQANAGYIPPQPPQYQDYYRPPQPQGPSQNYGQTQNNIIQVQPSVAGTVPYSQTVIIQPAEHIPGMGVYIALACVVFWSCNPLFGCIGFFIAIAGLSAQTATEVRRFGRASMWTSISGIIISVVISGILLALYFTGIIMASQDSISIIGNDDDSHMVVDVDVDTGHYHDYTG